MRYRRRHPRPDSFPLTHLWFLYYLLVLYVVVLVCRAVVVTLDRGGSIRRFTDTVVRGAVSSGAAAILLAVPLTLALYFRADWITWFGFPTPDSSLIPQLTSLVCFGTAIAFGWLVHRQTDLLQVWGKQWHIHLAAALAATAVCLSIAGMTPTFVPASPGLGTLAFALCYSLAVWCWSFATIGFALRFLAHASSAVRPTLRRRSTARGPGARRCRSSNRCGDPTLSTRTTSPCRSAGRWGPRAARSRRSLPKSGRCSTRRPDSWDRRRSSPVPGS